MIVLVKIDILKNLILEKKMGLVSHYLHFEHLKQIQFNIEKINNNWVASIKVYIRNDFIDVCSSSIMYVRDALIIYFK